MICLRRWNHETGSYEDYGVPDGWHVTTFEPDMETMINCASCGRPLPYGNTYTSMEIHASVTGFGYAVCETCKDAEFARASRKAREQEEAAKAAM